MLLFENISETPGHRAAVNLLTRERLCAAIGISPEEYIDTLAWAMENPSTPVLVEPSQSECFENQQSQVNLLEIPIPHHWPQDRGRYSSASVIIAEYDGIRNMSFHRQFLRDENHTVVRLVPRHLRTMMTTARENGDYVLGKEKIKVWVKPTENEVRQTVEGIKNVYMVQGPNFTKLLFYSGAPHIRKVVESIQKLQKYKRPSMVYHVKDEIFFIQQKFSRVLLHETLDTNPELVLMSSEIAV